MAAKLLIIRRLLSGVFVLDVSLAAKSGRETWSKSSKYCVLDLPNWFFGICFLESWNGTAVVYLIIFLAGSAGFEPANVGTKTRCLTTWRRPNSPYFNTFSGGIVYNR